MKPQILFIIVSLALVISIPEALYRSEFTNWMQKHKKSYGHEDFFMRYKIFKKNMDLVSNHDPAVGYKVALNKFADLSVQEFSRLYKGFQKLEIHKDQISSEAVNSTYSSLEVPTSWDWRTRGAVTKVKNQGKINEHQTKK
eukprot:TRINITY_DN12572_c0_g1_i1.p1 TRINITY_DN12572_c0_g1~~TRINITY_DN12572_c0_g1_i1.p1  ORF type:complete len:141 (-),score=15.46 TRINITY_DN12572_c0_g1_i1:93-515(-)